MNGPLRVLHVLSSVRLTGIAEPVLGLCAALAARGHHVELACPYGSKLAEHARQRGIPIWDGLALSSGWNLADMRGLRARASDFDVIHLHHARTHWLGALALGKGHRRPVLLAHHHSSRPLRADFLHRWLYARMDGIIEVSAQTGDVDARRLGCPAYHLPGAVDVEEIVPTRDSRAVRERLGIPADAVVVAMWSRLDPDRLHGVLLSTFASLYREFPAAWLLFAGSGEYRTRLLARAEALGVGARLVIAGRNDLAFPETRATTDVLVHLAEGSDGSCRTVLEGMAAGLPVIAARVGVIGDYVRDGENGLAIDRAEPPMLAEALRRVLADSALRERLGRQARADAAAHYDRRQQAETLESIYHQAAAKQLQKPR